MKKRRLKRWVGVTLEVFILIVIGTIILIGMAKRVEQINNNISKCGSNYCNK